MPNELDLSKIVQLEFPKKQYIQEVYPKTQLPLHHSGSGRGINGDWRYWLGTKDRIATSKFIDYTGVIYSFFNSKYYAFHLGGWIEG